MISIVFFFFRFEFLDSIAGIDELRLSDGEDGILKFEVEQSTEASADLSLCLIGRFLTNKPIKNHVMKEHIW